MSTKTKNKTIRDRLHKRSRLGFSLVELIVVVAIMAVLVAVLAPSLLAYVESSRAQKDTSAMDEVTNAVLLAMSDQDIYDELLDHNVKGNVSCYIDQDSETKVSDHKTPDAAAEQYAFADAARTLDEVPYYAAGNMRGVTITFKSTAGSKTASYVLADGAINQFVGGNGSKMESCATLYDRVSATVGEKIDLTSQTYRNSEYTIFIKMGTLGGADASSQDAIKVYGQFNGTNLPAIEDNQIRVVQERQTDSGGQTGTPETPITPTADNTIVLPDGLSAGTYTLRYEDEAGIMTDYADICSLEVTDSNEAVKYEGLIPENCAPVGATIIGVYNSNDEKVEEIPLGNLSTNLGTKLYTFGAIADIHVREDVTHQSTILADKALDYLHNVANVDFTCIPGDLTSSGSEGDFTVLNNLINQYGTVYVSTGNHDTYEYREEHISDDYLIEKTGNPRYYSFTVGDDVFIMFGVRRECKGMMFSDEAEQWLYETLEANRNKRVFLFQHVYPSGTSGNPHNAYENSPILTDLEAEFFNNLLAHYPNITLFHGHSHNIFSTQEIVSNATIDTSSTYNSIHIPSVSRPKELVYEDGTWTQQYNYETSEGYIIEVYTDGILLKGIDFNTGKYIPIAQYYISTPIQTVAADTFEDTTVSAKPEDVDFVWMYGTDGSKSTGVIYAEGESQEYSVSKPISMDANYTYRLNTSYYDLEVSLYTFCYAADGTYLGCVKLCDDSGDYELRAAKILEFPEGTATFRLRVCDGGSENYDSITNSFTIVRAPK